MLLMERDIEMQSSKSARELSNGIHYQNSGTSGGNGFHFRCYKGRLYAEQSQLASVGAGQGGMLILQGERSQEAVQTALLCR